MTTSPVSTLVVASALISLAFLAPTTNAHQVVLLPKPQWTTTNRDTQHNPLAFLESQGFKTQADFKSWREKNGYKSLRDFMDRAKYTVTEGADFSCGFTDPKGKPQPIPDGHMRFTGYTHDGPCETYLDDKLVLEGENCHEKFPGKDAPVDYSSCKGSCMFRWYWLGVRFLKNSYSWQVYKACIPLAGSGSSEPTHPTHHANDTSTNGSPKTLREVSVEKYAKQNHPFKNVMVAIETGNEDHALAIAHELQLNIQRKLDTTQWNT
ncbi:hypothetical protein PHMEG_000141 [Phytophthora megakarya]|uniref:RxLR effector protein n=1 Tax=Phytophthora megakarya TaxID=4795 RepID=A0A225X613_9STRA|nr:hypothetical protein PHMEG_000141 [Phytophthora megakarya]